jgi:hypothetical protein
MDNKPNTGLTATLEAAQWDRIGTMLMGQLSQHKAETAAIEPIVASLRAQLQAKPVQSNGKPVQMAPSGPDIQEVFPEPDVPSTA